MTDTATPTVTIDDKEYALDALSDEVKANLTSVQLVDQKIAQAQQEIAILQTARNAYVASLKAALPSE